MNCLAIDCSTEILGVALSRNRITPHGSGPEGSDTQALLPKHPYKTRQSSLVDDGFISLSVDAGYKHAERLMSTVDYCMRALDLAAAELDLLVCSGGPGSFTGLRIALATLKGLALGTGKPFVLVPTLEMLAWPYRTLPAYIVPMLDAKRSHCYAAVYYQGALVQEVRDLAPDELVRSLPQDRPLLFVGPHGRKLAPLFPPREGWAFAPDQRQAPLDSLIELALTKFESEGPAASDSSLWYVRASDAEEALIAGSTT